MKRLVRLSIIVLLVAACASSYRAASITANVNTKQYAEARDALKAAHTAGGLTEAQWSRWGSIRAEVQALIQEHDRAIKVWRESGIKPPSYDTIAANLFAAEKKMVDLKAEVLP